jgi:hypothetical protein
MGSLHDQRLWALAAFYGIFIASRVHSATEIKPLISDLVWDVCQAGRVQAEAETVQMRALLTFERTLLHKLSGGRFSSHVIAIRSSSEPTS